MADYPNREHFIPIRKAELVERLAVGEQVSAEDRDDCRLFSRILASIFHFEFHARTEMLKENYQPFNPDRDTLTTQRLDASALQAREKQLIQGFQGVLNQANYQQIGESDLAYAMNRESLFRINLVVDFNDFEHQLIFRRGTRSHRIQCKKWLFRREAVDITVYERVALVVKYKDANYFEARQRKAENFTPGSMIVKLFKNIPKGDLEMLFPNAQVRMKLKDKLIMGGVAFGGGITVMLKAGAGLLAMASILWLMARTVVASGGQMPALGPVEISGMVGGITALSAIAAFLFKQWNGYKNRKIKFMKTLGDNLYFKNLDNNAGVFYHIIADAEEEEFKEALLAYVFLVASDAGLTAQALDDAIEAWFERTYGIGIDFEISDALDKLKRLDLCMVHDIGAAGEPVWLARPFKQACTVLDKRWDDFFRANPSHPITQKPQ